MAEEATTTTEETTDAGDTTAADAGADTAGAEADAATSQAAPDDTSAAAEPSAGASSRSNAAADVHRIEVKDPREEELARLTAQIEAEDFDQFTAAGRKLMNRRQDVAAELAAERPYKIARQQQEQAANYWKQWGRGQDVAQLQFGRNVPSAKAKQLFEQAAQSVEANPRYANRPEMNTATIVYDKWMDLLAAEAKNPGATKTTTQTKPTPATRASGRGGTEAPSTTTSNKTARQKLAEGAYDFSRDRELLGD